MIKAIGAADVVITTAAVPGRRAPILITKEAVAAMAPGSVIVDLAAETGGNCELTVTGETIQSPNGVTIVGTTNLPSTVAGRCQPALLEERADAARVLHQGWSDRPRHDRRDHRRHDARARRQIVHKPTLDALAKGSA